MYYYSLLDEKGNVNFDPSADTNSHNTERGSNTINNDSGQTIHHFQYDNKIIQKEILLDDGSKIHQDYPFNLDTNSSITNIHIKCDSMRIKLGEMIKTDAFSFVDINQGTVKIWNASYSPNEVISNVGNSYYNCYKIKDYESNLIRILNKYEIQNWKIPNMRLSYLTIEGDNNIITIEDESLLASSFVLKIYGDNRFSSPCTIFNSLNIASTAQEVRMNGSVTENLNVELEGNGIIDGIIVKKDGYCKLAGGGKINIGHYKDAKIRESIFGIGLICKAEEAKNPFDSKV